MPDFVVPIASLLCLVASPSFAGDMNTPILSIPRREFLFHFCLLFECNGSSCKLWLVWLDKTNKPKGMNVNVKYVRRV